MSEPKDPVEVFVRQIIQASFYARLIASGERVISGESPYVAVFPPSDREYDAVRSCMEQQGLIPKSSLSVASTDNPNGYKEVVDL